MKEILIVVPVAVTLGCSAPNSLGYFNKDVASTIDDSEYKEGVLEDAKGIINGLKFDVDIDQVSNIINLSDGSILSVNKLGIVYNEEQYTMHAHFFKLHINLEIQKIQPNNDGTIYLKTNKGDGNLNRGDVAGLLFYLKKDNDGVKYFKEDGFYIKIDGKDIHLVKEKKETEL